MKNIKLLSLSALILFALTLSSCNNTKKKATEAKSDTVEIVKSGCDGCTGCDDKAVKETGCGEEEVVTSNCKSDSTHKEACCKEKAEKECKTECKGDTACQSACEAKAEKKCCSDKE